jgi:hypothetical protein
MSVDPPLKIAFSIVRVARSDPAERLLVDQLLNWNPSLRNATKTLLFPVFGRGRVLPPAVGEGIRSEVIATMARLLTGPCSCQIKAMNPGFDLLMAAKWDALLEGRERPDPAPPPLVGISRFAANATNTSPVPSGPSAPSLARANATSRPDEPHHLLRNLAFVSGIGVTFLAAATLILKVRAKRTFH